MVRILGAEAREDDLRLVGLAVAVGIAKVNQFGAVGDVGAAVAGNDAGRDEQPVGEDGRLVGFTVVVGVGEHQDLVGGDLPRLDLRIDFARRDPQSPLSIEVHLDRLRHERIGGPQVHLEPFRDDERLAFDFRIGVGDVLEFALSERGLRDANAR